MQYKIKNEIEREFNIYWNKVESLANSVFENEVVPFCKKRNWTFFSGMGDFSFRNKNGETMDIYLSPNDKEFVELCELLNVEILGNPANSIGTIMPQYEL